MLKKVKIIAQYILAKTNFILNFKRTKEGRCVIIATPVHGNLGDQAIVYAEKNMLKRIYPEKQILEIPNYAYVLFPKLCKKYISSKDIVVIDGGGNLGSLWPWEDEKISNIISDFQHNKIYIFPQTCYYDLQKDLPLIERNREIYDVADDLTVMLRDHRSFETFQTLYPNTKSILIPDIVFSLHPDLKVTRQNKVLLCFREDLEKNIGDADRKLIEDFLHSKGVGFECTSTLVNKRVVEKNRDKMLNKKWIEFSSAKLVITDRLHAMIFSAITETPCIAIDNLSKKVSGAYEWIKDLDYVKCVDSTDEMIKLISDMISKNDCKNDFEYPEQQIKEIMK